MELCSTGLPKTKCLWTSPKSSNYATAQKSFLKNRPHVGALNAVTLLKLPAGSGLF